MYNSSFIQPANEHFLLRRFNICFMTNRNNIKLIKLITRLLLLVTLPLWLIGCSSLPNNHITPNKTAEPGLFRRPLCAALSGRRR